MKPYQEGKGRPKQTRAVVQGRVFDADSALTPDYRAYLRGADITRFIVAPIERRFIRYGEWLAEPRTAAGFDAPEKIVLRQTGDSLVAAIDRQQYVCMNNMHVAVPKGADVNLGYIVGLLNSKLMNWYYQTLNPEVGEALAEVKKTNIDRLPIPACGKDEASAIGRHARAIEKALRDVRSARDEASRRSAQRNLSSSVELLNQAVYKLFKLSSDQVRLIEVAQEEHVVS
jgi:hypothetical protein